MIGIGEEVGGDVGGTGDSMRGGVLGMKCCDESTSTKLDSEGTGVGPSGEAVTET